MKKLVLQITLLLFAWDVFAFTIIPNPITPAEDQNFSAQPAFFKTLFEKRKKKQSKKTRKVSKKKKSKKGKKGKATKRCPAGVGPMNYRRCSSKQERIIKRVVGSKHYKCYSRLFVTEAGSRCSHTVYHDPKKAHNPHAGIGLCALEKSKAIRKRNRRGKNCMDISTFAKQVRCCRDIMRKHGAAYFGTVKCGKAPKCN